MDARQIALLVGALANNEDSVPLCEDESVYEAGLLFLTWMPLTLHQISLFAEALRQNTTVKTLHLSYVDLGDAGAEQIASMLESNHTIEVLFLVSCQIGSAGAGYLARALNHHPSLKEIYLAANQIGDDGAAMIAGVISVNQSLRRIHLANNQISDRGIVKLADALLDNHVLQSLSLGLNFFREDGAMHLYESLKRNVTLQKMDISTNRFQKHIVHLIQNQLSINSRIFRLLSSHTYPDKKLCHYLLWLLTEKTDAGIVPVFSIFYASLKAASIAAVSQYLADATINASALCRVTRDVQDWLLPRHAEACHSMRLFAVRAQKDQQSQPGDADEIVSWQLAYHH